MQIGCDSPLQCKWELETVGFWWCEEICIIKIRSCKAGDVYLMLTWFTEWPKLSLETKEPFGRIRRKTLQQSRLAKEVGKDRQKCSVLWVCCCEGTLAIIVVVQEHARTEHAKNGIVSVSKQLWPVNKTVDFWGCIWWRLVRSHMCWRLLGRPWPDLRCNMTNQSFLLHFLYLLHSCGCSMKGQAWQKWGKTLGFKHWCHSIDAFRPNGQVLWVQMSWCCILSQKIFAGRRSWTLTLQLFPDFRPDTACMVRSCEASSETVWMKWLRDHILKIECTSTVDGSTMGYAQLDFARLIKLICDIAPAYDKFEITFWDFRSDSRLGIAQPRHSRVHDHGANAMLHACVRFSGSLRECTSENSSLWIHFAVHCWCWCLKALTADAKGWVVQHHGSAGLGTVGLRDLS